MGATIKEALDEPEMSVDPAERYMFENIGEERTPLLVFVNKGSGGSQGKALLNSLKEFLNPMQVGRGPGLGLGLGLGRRLGLG